MNCGENDDGVLLETVACEDGNCIKGEQHSHDDHDCNGNQVERDYEAVQIRVRNRLLFYRLLYMRASLRRIDLKWRASAEEEKKVSQS